ncbi:hypothetical protein CLV47_101136 [Antricoccus suffuscus]|uniref:Uncharacterized protein n=1 Tax=Antricoccus suffuscus TaxID=1629062 RepID=A0A2T1A5X3_9ACTN|nr:hypothetical protein CLV47_101136 [Antricoccus suffuscus]
MSLSSGSTYLKKMAPIDSSCSLADTAAFISRTASGVMVSSLSTTTHISVLASLNTRFNEAHFPIVDLFANSRIGKVAVLERCWINNLVRSALPSSTTYQVKSVSDCTRRLSYSSSSRSARFRVVVTTARLGESLMISPREGLVTMCPRRLDDAGGHHDLAPKTRAGTPATTISGGTSRVTTAPAATTDPCPTLTPARILAPAPIQTSLLITTGTNSIG